MKNKKIILILVPPLIFLLILMIFRLDTLKPKLKEITNVEIVEINEKELILEVSVELKNEFFFAVKLRQANLSIISDNGKIGEIKDSSNSVIPPDSSVVITMKALFSTQKVAELIQTENDTIKLKLEGSVSGKSLFIPVSTSINETLTLPLKDYLTGSLNSKTGSGKIIKVESAQIENVSITKSIIKINFSLNNPYNIPVKLTGYPAKIFVNGNYTGEGNLVDSITLPPLGSVQGGEFLFDADNIQSIKSFLSGIFSGKMIYRTEGILNFEILELPVSLPYNSSGDLIKL